MRNVLTAITIWALCGCVSAKNTEQPFNVQLSEHNGNIIKLSITNGGDKTAYLDAYNTCVQGQMIRDFLITSSSKNVSITYKGKIRDRARVLNKKQYIAFMPKEVKQYLINMDAFFSMSEGEEYKVKYNAYNRNMGVEKKGQDINSNSLSLISRKNSITVASNCNELE